MHITRFFFLLTCSSSLVSLLAVFCSSVTYTDFFIHVAEKKESEMQLTFLCLFPLCNYDSCKLKAIQCWNCQTF